MAQRYIYISDELNSKLKQEENASRLIQNLLNKHYKLIEEANQAINETDLDRQIQIAKIQLKALEEIEKLK